MVFASLTLPRLRRCILPIVCIVFTSISCFGATAFLTVPSTPYDRQMVRVFPALNSANTQRPDSISLLAVSHLMMQLRNMPYEYSSRWQTPAEVDFAQAADCKGKALALYAQMRRNGAKNVRVVIGRRHIYDSGTHAWLEWQAKEGSYVLDPTFNDMPTRTAEISPATYVPLYAYDGEHKYRANAASSVAPSAKVATGIYVPARSASTLTRPTFAGVGSRPSVSSPPARILTTQHLQRNAQPTVSTTWRSSSTVGSKPTVSSTPVRTATTQRQQLNAQRTVSVARRTSPNVEKVRPSRVVVASSKTKSVVSTHRKSAVAGRRLLTQKGHTRHRRHIASKAARLRHVRGPVISQNERFVIPMDPTRLPP
jgi:hypothetical protein